LGNNNRKAANKLTPFSSKARTRAYHFPIRVFAL
jgi:hypothetical protein